jgi:hypothetical protein
MASKHLASTLLIHCSSGGQQQAMTGPLLLQGYRGRGLISVGMWPKPMEGQGKGKVQWTMGMCRPRVGTCMPV